MDKHVNNSQQTFLVFNNLNIYGWKYIIKYQHNYMEVRVYKNQTDTVYLGKKDVVFD